MKIYIRKNLADCFNVSALDNESLIKLLIPGNMSFVLLAILYDIASTLVIFFNPSEFPSV